MGESISRSVPTAHEIDPHAPQQEIIKKDYKFYRRTGNLWSDLNHTPKSRLHLVLSPQIVEADIAAVAHIQKCIKREKEVEALERERIMSRAEEIRRDFRKQVRRREKA